MAVFLKSIERREKTQTVRPEMERGLHIRPKFLHFTRTAVQSQPPTEKRRENKKNEKAHSLKIEKQLQNRKQNRAESADSA